MPIHATRPTLPEAARQGLRALHRRFCALEEEAAALGKTIVAHARQDEMARRLATIPGVGPITAYRPVGDPSRRAQPRRRLRGIAATVANIGLFKSARHFAAWLGLVPRQHSTGGKARLGRITKAGNSAIRTSPVLGATSMAFRAGQWDSAAGAWLRGVLGRRPARLATVAPANKMARITPPAALPPSASRSERQEALALMTRKEDYRPHGRVVAAAVPGAVAVA